TTRAKQTSQRLANATHRVTDAREPRRFFMLPNTCAQLGTISPEIGKLHNLTFLSLSGNPIPEAERERIRRLVPAGCKVYF
ncbi:MAG: hypothetical protein ABMA02_15345, partial [Saprospiraceae bacterium]